MTAGRTRPARCRGGGAGDGPHRQAQDTTGDAGELAAVVDRLGALLDVPASELEERDAEELRARVQVLRRVEGMAAAALAATVGALARSGAIRADGASSTTAWVAEQTGRSRRDAARTTRLSGALDDLPATATARPPDSSVRRRPTPSPGPSPTAGWAPPTRSRRPCCPWPATGPNGGPPPGRRTAVRFGHWS